MQFLLALTKRSNCDGSVFGEDRNARPMVVLDVATFQLDNAIGHAVISIIVGDNDHCFSSGFEIGQHFVIEDFLE